jgi:hypothetical protein
MIPRTRIGKLVTAVVAGARTGTINPRAADILEGKINQQVSEQGHKFSKRQVGYIAIFPPPLFWDYRCQECRKFKETQECEWVAGRISEVGWCTISLPKTPVEKPFSWLSRITEFPKLYAQAFSNLITDPFTDS